MILGTLTSVTRLEHIKEGLDYCQVEIEFDNHKIFYDYNKLLEFMNKRVMYDVMPDMYKGQQITTVVNLAEVYKVNTLDKKENIKLVTQDNTLRPGCTFDSKLLAHGKSENMCVAYLSSFKEGSSDKSEWVDCTMVDKNSRVFTLRVFKRGAKCEGDFLATIKNMVGHYVSFSVVHTQYGFQSIGDFELLDIPVMMPPEVETAISIIMEEAAKDTELMNYIETFNYIEIMKDVIDVEPGFHLVRVASELSLINEVENLSNLYDFKLLKRAAVTSRGYLLPTKTRFSRPVLNVTKIMKTKLATDRELLLILDPASDEEASATKRVYIDIAKFANKLVNERRGLNEESFSDAINVDSLRQSTGGLF